MPMWMFRVGLFLSCSYGDSRRAVFTPNRWPCDQADRLGIRVCRNVSYSGRNNASERPYLIVSIKHEDMSPFQPGAKSTSCSK